MFGRTRPLGPQANAAVDRDASPERRPDSFPERTSENSAHCPPPRNSQRSFNADAAEVGYAVEAPLSRDFLSLLTQHATLDELFLCHQESLIALRPLLARRFLFVYRELLTAHMNYEDEVLLPVYQRVGPTERAPVVLYTGQHRKMNLLLDAIEQLMQPLIDAPEHPRRQVIQIIDIESTLKNLTEHHDVAESQALYAVLESTITGDERERLVAGGWTAWQERSDAVSSALDAARAQLATL